MSDTIRAVVTRKGIFEVTGGLALALTYVFVMQFQPVASLAQLLPPDEPPPAQTEPGIQPDRGEDRDAERGNNADESANANADDNSQAQNDAGNADNGSNATAAEGDREPSRRVLTQRNEMARQLGITSAERRLGFNTPTGRGIGVGHVEGETGNYTPHVGSDKRGIAFVKRSGESEPNGHATSTANIIYGRNGMAPGISLVHSFTAPGWMTDEYLHTGEPEPPSESSTDDKLRVFTHSWIGFPEQATEQILRRVDYQIDTRDVVMAVGVNNGDDSEVPPLLASSYNAIAVGLLNGNSSGGYTQHAGEGRSKPDIVAPAGLTSHATPAIAALAARLLEAADAMAGDQDDGGSGSESDDGVPAMLRRPAVNDDARRAEVIKAVLLAGATKPEGWAPPAGKPLDEHLGAGLANFDYSLQALQAGQSDPSRIRQRTGWSFQSLGKGETDRFRIEPRQAGQPLSIALTWNRRVFGSRANATNNETGESKLVWVAIPRMTDLNLKLIRVNDNGQDELVAESASEVDNVEHLYVPELAAGRYRIEVTRADGGDEPDQLWEYAMAWRYGQ